MVSVPDTRFAGRVGVVYRRKWGTATWHWSPECSAWPRQLECEERDTTPKIGAFCAECQAKAPEGPSASSGSEAPKSPRRT